MLFLSLTFFSNLPNKTIIKMIKYSYIKNYRIKEFLQFIANILLIVKQDNPENLKIQPQVDDLAKRYGELENAYKQHSGSELTPQLAALDARRDQAIVCFRQISEGYTNHHDEALSSAGRTLLSCIDKYGSKLYLLNYSAETAALKNLTRDLRTIPECAAALTSLNLDDTVGHLEATNSEFEQLFVQRLKSLSGESKSTEELSQQTKDAYDTLTRHIEAYATIEPSASYTTLINHINENIDHFNQLVEKRRNSKAPEEAEPDQPTAGSSV